jgi:hypothetical protein
MGEREYVCNTCHQLLEHKPDVGKTMGYAVSDRPCRKKESGMEDEKRKLQGEE